MCDLEQVSLALQETKQGQLQYLLLRNFMRSKLDNPRSQQALNTSFDQIMMTYTEKFINARKTISTYLSLSFFF